MKYILYYLIPRKFSYNMLYETMSMTSGTLSFAEPHMSYLKTTYFNYQIYRFKFN